MDFSGYYSKCFRSDLRQFVMAIPAESRHCHTDHNEFTIQIHTLWKDSPYLDCMRSENYANFAVALFFTVLVDEVCYTYYQPHYATFRRLTRYPKLIGNCPGGCCCHNHPKVIFTAINFSRTVEGLRKRADIDVSGVFRKAIPVMRKEVIGFFRDHMPAMNAEEFWEKCTKEFPL